MRKSVAVTMMLLSLLSAAFGQSTARNRILQPIDSSAVVAIKDNIHHLARAEFDRGKTDAALRINRVTMVFKLSSAQQADLDSLLKQQTDPGSPNYHKWLTPEQFGKRFGLSDADFAKVATWLQSQGFEVVDAPASRTSITFNGTAAQVSSAFHTEIHNYVVNGETHYANANAPFVPAAFSDIVLGLRSLNDFRPKPRSIISHKVNPNFTSSISGSHYLAPDDVATIYNIKGLYNAGYDGTGQKLVVVGQTDIIASDIAAFRSASGLNASTPTVVLVPGSKDPGVVSGDIEEANLDLQWSGAIAKNATIIYVNSDNGAFDSLQYAISSNLAPVISISYGSCEQTFSTTEINILTSLAQQASAQGITISAAAGDSGAADCDYSSATNPVTTATQGLAVDIPAAIPYVTGIGGTEFDEGNGNYWDTTNNSNSGSALAYIPEVVWNDTTSNIASGGGLNATGGGKSTIFAKPSWQTGTGVPADGMRDVPDISFNASPAHDGYLVCSQGSCVNGYRDSGSFLTVFGGTSAGAPVFAAIVALINQKTGSSQGNINPTLYGVASTTPSAFHDVTSSDNKVPCTAGTPDCATGGSIGYSATTGYDLATGLGSLDAFAFASALTGGSTTDPDFQLSTSTSSLTLAGGTTGTSTITATALNGFGGSVTWSCGVSSSLAAVASCTVTPDSSTPNAKAVLTIATVKQTASVAPANTRRAGWLFAAVFPFGILLTGMRFKNTSRSSRFCGACVLVLIAVAIAMMTGCGGGSSTAKATSSIKSVSGTVTVQAASGTITHTTALSVTVQ